MRKVVAVLLIALVAVVARWLWPNHVTYANLPPTATGPWIAFGDSLTAGFGAENKQDYPTQLGATLRVSIENAGRNGETSLDGLHRVEAIANRNPRVVLLCFGGNDALQQMHAIRRLQI